MMTSTGIIKNQISSPLLMFVAKMCNQNFVFCWTAQEIHLELNPLSNIESENLSAMMELVGSHELLW